MSRWVEGKVISQKQWTPSLYSLYVQAPIDTFVAGQFTQIGLMIEKQILFRPYSFVNAPDDPILEFYYTHLATGQLTNKLIHLQPNDTLYIARKGSGRFTLAHVPEGDALWLIATGTGLGVFLSLLRSEEVLRRFSKVILIHSVRKQDELTHHEVIASFHQRFGAGFHYIPIVTREQVSGIMSERIPDLLIKGQLEQHANVLLAQHSQVMLCGNPAMVKAVTSVLESRGIARNQITVESYWKE